MLIQHDYRNLEGIYLTFSMACMNDQQFWMDHPFSSYVKFFETLAFLRYPHELVSIRG